MSRPFSRRAGGARTSGLDCSPGADIRETAAERYARHLEHKPTILSEDAPTNQAWFWKRQYAIWTRLEPEYAEEVAREAAGFPTDQDPPWWSKTDQELREIARGCGIEASMVTDRLIEMRAGRVALIEARTRLVAEGQ